MVQLGDVKFLSAQPKTGGKSRCAGTEAGPTTKNCTDNPQKSCKEKCAREEDCLRPGLAPSVSQADQGQVVEFVKNNGDDRT